MARGYFGIGLYMPKTGENVGGSLRAANCYGAAFVAIEGGRNNFLKHATNTASAQKHMPVFTEGVVFDHVPNGCEIVVVDLIDGAISLVDFFHPPRAFYLFGPEDGTLGIKHTPRAHHVVFVPTRFCMNLASTVNVVLYDRMAKGLCP